MINKFIIILFIVIFSYLINSKKSLDNFVGQEYNFVKLIKKWDKIYKQINYNNKPIYVLDNKYESHLMCKNLNIPTPELYYYGSYNKVPKNIFNKEAFVIKPVRDNSSRNVFLLVKHNNKYINKLNINKSINIDDLDNIFKNKTVIIEEFIKNNLGKYTVPDDFKIFCFKGKPEFIWHKYYAQGKYYQYYYDINWNSIDLKTNHYRQGIKVPKPKKLDKMIDYCKNISSKAFSEVFVRLDFYLNKDEPVFGEVSPCPNGGYGYDNKSASFLNNLCKKHNLVYNDK